jgi:hypothetical protein
LPPPPRHTDLFCLYRSAVSTHPLPQPSELQSAIGRIQLQCLPEWTAARTRTALLFAEALA